MSNVISRVLIFALGIPAVGALIYFLPQWNHIGVALVVCLFSALGGQEFYNILAGPRRTKAGWCTAFIAALLLPLSGYLAEVGLISVDLPLSILTIYVLFILSRQIFTKTDNVGSILYRVEEQLFPALYPGLLAVFLVRIGTLPNATFLYFAFFAMTFGNDSLAWFTGSYFGKKRNIIPISPNKSVAGFIGGIAASLIVGVACPLFWPQVFPQGLLKWIGLGFCVGVAVILGDLAESALKRSAGIKDSGSVIPGRGGVLDSIDSLLFAAPVFYYLVHFFF
jgi:phosphatidate cytidylyltransferase